MFYRPPTANQLLHDLNQIPEDFEPIDLGMDREGSAEPAVNSNFTRIGKECGINIDLTPMRLKILTRLVREEFA